MARPNFVYNLDKRSIIALFAVIINLAFICSIFLVQYYEFRDRIIEERGPNFLYQQDFATSSWGDIIGLTLIDFYVFYRFNMIKLTKRKIIGIVLIGLIAVMAFFFISNNYKYEPTSGFPEKNSPSYSGIIHLFYFYIQSMIFFIGLICLIKNEVEYINSFTLGLAIYSVALLRDIILGYLL